MGIMYRLPFARGRLSFMPGIAARACDMLRLVCARPGVSLVDIASAPRGDKIGRGQATREASKRHGLEPSNPSCEPRGRWPALVLEKLKGCRELSSPSRLAARLASRPEDIEVTR